MPATLTDADIDRLAPLTDADIEKHDSDNSTGGVVANIARGGRDAVAALPGAIVSNAKEALTNPFGPAVAAVQQTAGSLWNPDPNAIAKADQAEKSGNHREAATRRILAHLPMGDDLGDFIFTEDRATADHALGKIATNLLLMKLAGDAPGAVESAAGPVKAAAKAGGADMLFGTAKVAAGASTAKLGPVGEFGLGYPLVRSGAKQIVRGAKAAYQAGKEAGTPAAEPTPAPATTPAEPPALPSPTLDDIAKGLGAKSFEQATPQQQTMAQKAWADIHRPAPTSANAPPTSAPTPAPEEAPPMAGPVEQPRPGPLAPNFNPVGQPKPLVRVPSVAAGTPQLATGSQPIVAEIPREMVETIPATPSPHPPPEAFKAAFQAKRAQILADQLHKAQVTYQEAAGLKPESLSDQQWETLLGKDPETGVQYHTPSQETLDQARVLLSHKYAASQNPKALAAAKALADQ